MWSTVRVMTCQALMTDYSIPRGCKGSNSRSEALISLTEPSLTVGLLPRLFGQADGSPTVKEGSDVAL